MVLDTLDTYAEVSPSGEGIKAFFYLVSDAVRPFLDQIGVAATQWGCRRGIPGENSGDHGPAIEFYALARYFAVTGQRWSDAPARLRLIDPNDLGRLARLIPPPKAAAGTGTGKSARGDTSRSAAAFRLAASMKAQGKTFADWVTELRSDPDCRDWIHDKGDERQLRRTWDRAGPATSTGVKLDDFWALMPTHTYLFAPTGESWPAASVNSRLPQIRVGTDANGESVTLKAAQWLDRNKPVEQMTWLPGAPMLIEDRLMLEGGWLERPGVTCFNLYRPPAVTPGRADRAGPWVKHLKLIYPDDADHLLDWLAQRVQRPDEKLNHAIVLGGEPGIGKDSLLEPVKHAVGPWNFQEASPPQVLGRFNSFLRAVVLRVSEAHDLGEFDRFQFYDRMKSYIAAPPDTLRVDEKFLREYVIPNVCGVIITTNHKTDGIYLPAEDRRHYVAWSTRTKDDAAFQNGYWNRLWAFYRNGGIADVVAFLAQRDISGFDPKAPPPKTESFWAIADANRASEEPELADLLDQLDMPNALTLTRLQLNADVEFAGWLKDRKNRRIIPHRMEKCGYVPVRNPDATDGLWKINSKRQAVYARAGLTIRDQIAAAKELL